MGTNASTNTCEIVDEGGSRCGAAVADSPLRLCRRHLLEAHDWVVRDIGLTDLLPSPCRSCGSRLGVSYPSGWLCAICEWRVGDIPSDDLQMPRVDVVYYLRFGNRIKIGTSGNPRQRLGAILHDELLAFEPGNRMVEHKRHAQFADHRQGQSEWFDAHDALTEHIRQVNLGVTDPWAQYALWMSQAIALRT
jgi:hypothetical protein